MKMKKKNRTYQAGSGRAAALSVALVLSMAIPALGATPEFARSQEEWAALQDDYLGWEEIPDLVTEYNSTVLNNKKAYQKDQGQDAEEIRNSLLDAADDLDSLAVDAEMGEGQQLVAAGYRSQAASLRQQADSNVSDSEIIRWQYRQVEDTIVENVRNTFISYYQAISQKAADEAKLGYLEQAYQSAQNRKNVGTGTELEVLTAKESLQTAQAQLLTAEAGISSAKRRLQVLCGWDYNAEPEIGPLPEFDMQRIGEIDLTADTQLALENNWQLMIDERKLQNATDGLLRDQYEKTVQNDRQQIAASVRSAYDELISAKTAYDNGQLQLQLAQQNLDKSSRQLSLGVISRMEHAAVENELTTLQHSQELNEIAVFSAWTAYEAAVNGLAQTGSAQ